MNAVQYNTRRGYSGETWKVIQELIGTDVDGRPGPKTAAAVCRFQLSRFGSKHVDGCAGVAFMRALCLGPQPLISLDTDVYKCIPSLQVGIDVSVWQSKINWEAAAQYVDFAILRCMDGRLRTDKRFNRNRDECSEHCVPWGGYVPVRMLKYKPATVVKRLLDSCGHAPLPPCIDLEYRRVKEAHDKHPDLDGDWAVEAVELLVDNGVVDPYVYLSARSAALLGAEAMSRLAALAHLWWVDYGSQRLEPRRWGTDDWEMRQFSSHGRCIGVVGNVDLNVMNSKGTP